MEYTGERPTLVTGYSQSQRRYKAVIPHVVGKRALELGCGVGHGTALLSDFTKSIIGFDICKEAAEEAQASFGAEHCNFTHRWNEVPISELDIVVSVECIEHIEQDDLHQLLKMFSDFIPAFVGSTPNGDYHKYNPKSPEEREGFHVKHYTQAQLHNLFGQFYRFVTVLGVDFDKRINQFTSHLIFASNEYANWKVPRYDVDH